MYSGDGWQAARGRPRLCSRGPLRRGATGQLAGSIRWRNLELVALRAGRRGSDGDGAARARRHRPFVWRESASGRRHNRAVACDLSSRDAGDSLSRAGVGGAPTLEAPMVRITSAARAHRICEAVTKRARGLPSESPRQRAVPALDSPVAARLRLTKDRQSHSLRQRRELRQHLSEDARIARCVASSSKRRERDTVGEKRR